MNPEESHPCPTCYRTILPWHVGGGGSGLLPRTFETPQTPPPDGFDYSMSGKHVGKISDRAYIVCPTCEGTGEIDTLEKLSRAALELLEEG